MILLLLDDKVWIKQNNYCRITTYPRGYTFPWSLKTAEEERRWWLLSEYGVLGFLALRGWAEKESGKMAENRRNGKSVCNAIIPFILTSSLGKKNFIFWERGKKGAVIQERVSQKQMVKSKRKWKKGRSFGHWNRAFSAVCLFYFLACFWSGVGAVGRYQRYLMLYLEMDFLF